MAISGYKAKPESKIGEGTFLQERRPAASSSCPIATEAKSLAKGGGARNLSGSGAHEHAGAVATYVAPTTWLPFPVSMTLYPSRPPSLAA
jgi:hypothetical protein